LTLCAREADNTPGLEIAEFSSGNLHFAQHYR